MNDQEFFDLALKVIGHRASEAERAQLDTLVSSQPELKARFEEIQADARLAKKVLPLVAAVESSSGEFPAYARERLLTKVRKTLGPPQPTRVSQAWNWRWLLGLTAGATAVVLLLVPTLRAPDRASVQVAMLDTAGPVRGEDKDLDVLKAASGQSSVLTFSNAGQFDAWRITWPSGAETAAKVVYDRAAGEVRVILHSHGKNTEKTFAVGDDLAGAMRQANDLVRAQMGKK
jgi:hypothetical protein